MKSTLIKERVSHMLVVKGICRGWLAKLARLLSIVHWGRWRLSVGWLLTIGRLLSIRRLLGKIGATTIHGKGRSTERGRCLRRRSVRPRARAYLIVLIRCGSWRSSKRIRCRLMSEVPGSPHRTGLGRWWRPSAAERRARWRWRGCRWRRC